MSHENVEVIRSFFDALEREELDLHLCDPQIEILNDPGMPITKPYTGHDGVKAWFRDVYEVWEEPRFELDEVIDVSDDCVVMSHRLSGRGRASGIPLEWLWWSTVRFRNGRMVRVVGSVTRKQALQAAGLEE
jgi:ketosteroid isomerase-like protein